MDWKMGERKEARDSHQGRLGREEIHADLRLIHIVVQRKPTQHCKAIILQLKINNLKKKRERDSHL